MTTRTIQFGFVLALLGSQLAHGQSSLAINGIKAVWRSGNAFSYDTANCLSRGAYLTNICKDPQTVTFLTDLNTLIQSNSSLNLLLADDINDDGEIVGFATDTNTGATVAFLATPADEGAQARRDQRSGSASPSAVSQNSRRTLVGMFSRFVAGQSK